MGQGRVKEEMIMKREREGQFQVHAIPSATNATLACLLKYPSEQWNWKRKNTILKCGNVFATTTYSPLKCILRWITSTFYKIVIVICT
jgi:hypothetical protein